MQADRVDQSALGFDYQSKMEKHESQKGQQTDRKATGGADRGADMERQTKTILFQRMVE